MDEATLNKARERHYEAHINWEWWTASNGAHFHNPEEANESLNKSMVYLAGGHQAARRRDDRAARRGRGAEALGVGPVRAGDAGRS